MGAPLVEVAMAILYREGKFLMQLRDDFPHIVHPGIWGFFGGHLDPGEDADTSIHRELLEELGYVAPLLELFEAPEDGVKKRYYYHGELTVPITELQLNEGQDLGLCSVEEIQVGEKFSEKLGEMRSLGQPHQKILLKFIHSGLIHAHTS